jgi:hypothetical protein
LLEELRITQKLLDQGRVEREQHHKVAKAAATEMTALRGQMADRDARVSRPSSSRCGRPASASRACWVS